MAPGQQHCISLEPVMSEPTVTCPNCNSAIKLTESLAAPLIDAARKGGGVLPRRTPCQPKLPSRATGGIARSAGRSTRKWSSWTPSASAWRQEQEKARRTRRGDLRRRMNSLPTLNWFSTPRPENRPGPKAQADLIRKEREPTMQAGDGAYDREAVQTSLAAVRERAKKAKTLSR
jgi:hypothetical protein